MTHMTQQFHWPSYDGSFAKPKESTAVYMSYVQSQWNPPVFYRVKKLHLWYIVSTVSEWFLKLYMLPSIFLSI